MSESNQDVLFYKRTDCRKYPKYQNQMICGIAGEVAFALATRYDNNYHGLEKIQFYRKFDFERILLAVMLFTEICS